MKSQSSPLYVMLVYTRRPAVLMIDTPQEPATTWTLVIKASFSTFESPMGCLARFCSPSAGRAVSHLLL